MTGLILPALAALVAIATGIHMTRSPAAYLGRGTAPLRDPRIVILLGRLMLAAGALALLFTFIDSVSE